MNKLELEEKARLVRWSRFLAARSDEELEEAAKGDEMMEKAKDYLELLSAKPSVRELALQRELARITYQLEITEARAEGEAKGRAEERRELLFRLLEQRFGELSAEQRAQVEAADHYALLSRLFTAQSMDELIRS